MAHNVNLILPVSLQTKNNHWKQLNDKEMWQQQSVLLPMYQVEELSEIVAHRSLTSAMYCMHLTRSVL